MYTRCKWNIRNFNVTNTLDMYAMHTFGVYAQCIRSVNILNLYDSKASSKYTEFSFLLFFVYYTWFN